MGLKDLTSGHLTAPAEIAESFRLVELGHRLLDENPDWTRRQEDQRELTETLEELERAAKSIDGRLVMGLLGGTGVGKSTLISALAGEEISPAGPVRPTTSQPVVYRHQSFPSLTRLTGREVIHRAPALEALAIVDFPDFDSLETAHHQLVLDNLKDLDLVAWVTDPNKYADRRFYEVLAQVQKVIGPSAQVALLNKADQLSALNGNGEALDYVLGSFDGQLRDIGHWAGGRPWPISAAEGLANPKDRKSGGLTPLRDHLDTLAGAKMRRVMELGNLKTRNLDFRARLDRAARPGDWLRKLESLQQLALDFRPETAIAGDLAALTLAGPSYVAPRLDRLRKTATGLLALFSDGWDFVAGRFKPGHDLPPPTPEPAAPALTQYLLGRSEDLALVTGRPPSGTGVEIEKESSAVIQTALSEKFNREPKVRSTGLMIWPLALAALLIWAETGGQYGGPAALTAAALRSVAPWFIFSFFGDLVISRFIWFRARRFYEADFHRAMELAGRKLNDLANGYLGEPLAQAVERKTRQLDLLADLKNSSDNAGR